MPVFMDTGQTITPGLGSRAVRGGMLVALTSYATVLFGMLATIALTRILSSEHFGIFTLAAFYTGLLNLRTKIGVGFAFAQRPDTTGEMMGTYLTLDITASALSLVLALAAAPLMLRLGVTRDVVLVMLALSVVTVIEGTYLMAGVLLDKALHFGRNTLLTTISMPLSYIPAFILAWRGAGYWSLYVQALTQTLVVAVGTWWVCRHLLTEPWQVRWRFDKKVARELLSFGVTLGVGSIAALLMTQYDNFLIGTLVGVGILGFYDRAYRIAGWPNLLITNIVARTVFFTYAKLQDDTPRLARAFTMTLWLITASAIPMALVVFATASDLVTILYGERWLTSVVFLRLLVVFSLMRPLLEDIYGLLTAIGQPKLVSMLNWFHAGVLILVATPLTLWRGALGTAVGVGIAFIAGVVLAYILVKRFIALSLSRMFLPPALAALVALAVYVALQQWPTWQHLVPLSRLLLTGSAVGLSFYGTLLLVNPRQFIENTATIWRLLR
jgi:lipopolysaccharide exporter